MTHNKRRPITFMSDFPHFNASRVQLRQWLAVSKPHHMRPLTDGCRYELLALVPEGYTIMDCDTAQSIHIVRKLSGILGFLCRTECHQFSRINEKLSTIMELPKVQ